VQILALEYLRFADGQERVQRERDAEERHHKLLGTIVRAGLAAATTHGTYNEKILFQDYFPESRSESSGEASSDADVDFDFSGVDFGTPDMDEMAMLAQMLQDDMVVVDGAPLEGPDAIQVEREDLVGASSALPPPRDFDDSSVEQDVEWT